MPRNTDELIRELFPSETITIDETLNRKISGNYCRNNHTAYQVGERKIIAKSYLGNSTWTNEALFYRTFADFGLPVPAVYFSDSEHLVTEYIEHRKNPRLSQTIQDWASVHSQTIGFSNPSMPEHPFQPQVEGVASKMELLPEVSRRSLEILSRRVPRQIKCLVHGDLYDNNIANNGIRNYYFDFEFSGIGHPAEDLSLLLFNNYHMAGEIMSQYKGVIGFDYPELEEDIMTHLILRINRIIITLNSVKGIDGKEDLLRKSESILEKLLGN